MTTLSIVTVSYNTRELLRDCLQSIAAQTRVSHEVIVVDNASVDGTPAFIAERFPYVRLILNPSNSGFSAANNRGIREASGQFLLLLNPDTIILDGALDRMVHYLESHPQAGIVGAKLMNADETAQKQYTWCPNLFTYIFDRIMLWLWGERDSGDVEFVTGACLMIRAETMRQIGTLDENIFMYAEDADLCLRANRAGWKVYHNADAHIVHLAGQASRRDVAARVLNARQAFLYFFRKHHSCVSYCLLKVAILCEALAKILFDALTYPWVDSGGKLIKRTRMRGFASLIMQLPHPPRFTRPAR